MMSTSEANDKRGNSTMNKWLDRISAVICLMCACLFMQELAHAATLDDISFSSLPGDRVQLELKLSEPVSTKPLNFTIDNPARVVLDFPDTTLNLTEKNKSIGIGAVHSVSSVEAAGRTRVVLNLVKLVSYDMELEGDKVILTLDAASSTTSVATSSTAGSRRGAADTAAGGSTARIENIDFRRGEAGEGRIIVTLSDPSVGVNLGKEGEKVVVDFLDTTLPEELNRRLDVIDFATPVKEIDTSPFGKGARMVISTTTPNYDHLAYQSDNLLTIELKPLSAQQMESAQKEKFGYTGERLSLNFQNIEIRAVLQLIADFTGLNMVASDTVTGNVTLRLKNVPWDQALDIILKSKGLGMRKDGNVILVAPRQEIAAREKLELEANKQVEELAPMQTEFLQINYAKASDLATLIKADKNKLLSARGNVSIDDRTNTLIIQDVASSLESIRQMVAKLDIPVRQVLIESRIVNIDETFSKDLGVVFSGSKDKGAFPFPDSALTKSPSLATDFLVGLPVAASSGISLAYGIVGSYMLNLELTAALAEGRGEDIANPKVVTANKKEATIESGVEIPYQTTNKNGETTTIFKNAVLSLKVTPQITPDQRVLLDLEVTQDSQGVDVESGSAGGKIPTINKRHVNTQALVDNGETVVLGGVYSQNKNNAVSRIPFFSDIPYVGFLFKNTTISTEKRELLIFVTPKILKENLQL